MYPLPYKYIILINREIFYFVWGSYHYNPLKRDILYNSKNNGGIGLINIAQKSKSILVGTVIKDFLFSEREDLSRYYMANRVGNIFSITNPPRNSSRVNAPYYEFSVDTIKKCKDHKKFPNLKPKDIYEILVPQCKPDIEDLYHIYDWKNIWMQLSFRYMNLYDRNIMYLIVPYCKLVMGRR